MGLLGRAFAPDLILPDRLRRHARRRTSELVGSALLVAAGILAISLASWSVQDPSLNHAANREPENLLGYPGAAIADLAMQVFGLAAILAVFLFIRWGWRALTHQPLQRARRRSLAGLLALAMGAGFAATLPVPSTWPLPTGLGGFLGDRLLALPFAAISATPGLIGNALAGLMFLSAAASLFAFAVDMSLLDLLAQEEEDLDEEEEDEELEDEEEDGVATWPGALVHALLSARAQVARLVVRRRKSSPKPGLMARLSALLRGPADPLDDLRTLPDGRVEPVFAEDELEAEDYEDEEEEEEEEEEYEEDDEEGDDPHPVNVAPLRKQLKPGRGVRRERQPSFLAGEDYQLPPLRFLEAPPKAAGKKSAAMSQDALEQNARVLEGVLEDFGVKGEIINVRPGPVVTLYELEPAPGIKSSRVIGLADDIARSMSAIAARVAVVPGRNAIGIELPNAVRETVYLREILGSEDFERSKARLPLALGKTIGGEPVIADLARMPHLLIAGTTGSGKSVGINTMILSLLYRLSPEQCRLIMVDPKMLELSVYDGIPHLLAPVVTDPKKAIVALKWTVREMEDRYKKMSKLGVRNIDGFNQRVRQAIEKDEVITRTVQTGFDRETGEAIYETEEMELEPMPYLVVIVDEMADLMMVAGKDIEGAIQRLAQMARAAGIHMITATQRPSVDVITGTIKANFPTRISFQVTSKIDSRTILGEQGAEQLLGQGDMLHMAGGGRISRVHGPFVSDEEVEKVVKHLKAQGTPDYLDAVTEEDEDESYDMLSGMGGGNEGDDLYDRAVQVVLRDKKVSTSYIQRRLSIGYNRAATLIERMEQEGLISAANHAGKREILVDNGVD